MGSTGVPQGTVLSPFLFTIYTSDFSFRSATCHLQKFSDDSSIVGCITEDRDEEYRAVVENFIRWADQNHLLLNIKKTKELVIDARRSKRRDPVPITIQGEEVEIVDSYKFLGVHLNKNLDWGDNTEAIYKKGQSRLYLLRRLKSFNVCSRLLYMFYQSVVASILLYAVVCWGGGIKAGERNKLEKTIKKASSVVGLRMEGLQSVADRRIREKLNSIMGNPSHPLYADLQARKSTFSQRLTLPPNMNTERYRLSFWPTAIRLFNEHL